MGLAVMTGVLVEYAGDPEVLEQVREGLEQINALLRDHGLAEHSEPTEGIEPFDAAVGPYPDLHLLRRLAVHLAADGGLPDPGGEGDDFDPVLDAAYSEGDLDHPFAHLLFHADDEGYYVPVDFARPLTGELEGGAVGSSQALVRELERLEAALGDDRGRFEIESPVLDTLLEAARRSVADQALLAFS